MKKSLLLFAFVATIAPVTLISINQQAEARPVYIDEEVSEAAVGGYDTVSYFRGNGQPVKGLKKYKVKHYGRLYYFASSENAAAFKENPAAFAPQYGGHCAWAMSRGALAPGDPVYSKIVDGKLYLNFDKRVQTIWLGDVPGFVSKADKAWPTIPDDAEFGA